MSPELQSLLRRHDASADLIAEALTVSVRLGEDANLIPPGMEAVRARFVQASELILQLCEALAKEIT